MALTVALPDAAEPSPSGASLAGLDGMNFFNAAMLAGFGPYVAVYLAEQKWTQENIGFVLTAGGLAGLLAFIPGGELLDAVRLEAGSGSARRHHGRGQRVRYWNLAEPSAGFHRPGAARNHWRLPRAGDRCRHPRLSRSFGLVRTSGAQSELRFDGLSDRDRAHGLDRVFAVVPSDVRDRRRACPPAARCTSWDPRSRH